MAMTFVLLALLAQVALAVAARHAAAVAVAAAARQAAVPAAYIASIDDRLRTVMAATVPGAGEHIETTFDVDAASVSVSASFRWSPPGPDLIPLAFQVTATTPRDLPP